jgi:pilin isopeptide linkage protein
METSVIVPGGSTGNGIEASFGEIKFEQAGTFKFTVAETKEALPGITYDETVYTLVVVVKDTDGKLVVDSTSYEVNGEKISADAAAFNNPYAPDVTSVLPTVTKVLTGQEAPNEETFTFILKPETFVENGSYIAGAETAITAEDSWSQTITGGGVVKYDAIEYRKAGEYTYTLTEVDGDVNGWTYSKLIWTMTVKVTDLDGRLSCDTTYEAGESSSTTTAEFINNYEPAPVTWQAQVVKRLTQGSDVADRDSSFTFELSLASDLVNGSNLTSPVRAIASLPAGSRIAEPTTFAPITFTKAGTYGFLVKEIDEGAEGFTYDALAREITVVVTDNDGNLEVESTTITGGEWNTIDGIITVYMSNTYTTPTTLPNESGNVTTPALPDESGNVTTPAETPKTPDKNVPKTGDDFDMTRWILLLAIAAVVCVSLLIWERKKNRR